MTPTVLKHPALGNPLPGSITSASACRGSSQPEDTAAPLSKAERPRRCWIQIWRNDTCGCLGQVCCVCWTSMKCKSRKICTLLTLSLGQPAEITSTCTPGKRTGASPGGKKPSERRAEERECTQPRTARALPRQRFSHRPHLHLC